MRKSLILLSLMFAGLKAVTIGYDISLDQIKDKSGLMNSLSLSQQLTSRISLNAHASFTAEKNQDLNRFLEARNGTANLTFTPVRGIELGINLSRTISSEEKNNELIRDRLSNTTSGQIRYTAVSWLSVSIGLGSHFIDYMNPSGDSTITGHDEGGVRNVDISLNSTIFQGMSGSITLGEHRTLGYQKNTGNDNLSVRMNYDFPEVFEGGGLNAQISATKLFTTYNDSNRTQRQDNWSSNLSLVVPTPYDRLSMQISTAWDYSDRFYEYADPDTGSSNGDVLDRQQRQRNIASSLKYEILDNLSLSMNLSRNILRIDQKRTAAGVSTLFSTYYIDDDRLFRATLDYTPGTSRISFYRTIQLLKRDTYGTWTDIWGIEHRDNYDYDQFREVLALSTEIPLGSRIVLKTVIQGQSREILYIMSEQSGNSKRSSTYSIEPSFRYNAGSDWTLQQSVQISADYTTFLFPESSTAGSDLLFRRITTNSSFQRVSQDSTTLGLNHTFRFQDQGSYENSVFKRSEEVIGNTVKINLGFHVGGDIGLTPSYAWEYQKRNYLAQSIPSRTEHIHHVGLRTRMFLNDGTLSLNVTRSFYSRDDRQSYWKATVGLNYQF
ncbi:MAG: hypothetical protein GQ565_05470 [Candidatus Aegiribacteria sp.]|nr:hypothetical protein [Candidatus Aegiribacteria sp.]